MIKKQLIMEKALELFAEQGLEATSVQQITDRCGISKGAFYLSFKSKDELIVALIDHFMMQITTQIDYTVRNTKNSDELLYKFFFSSFNSFNQYSDFAKIFVKEHTHSFNEDLIAKMRYYAHLQDKTILSMVEKVYGDAVQDTKYDLVYTIKGFMKNYTELFLFYTLPIDLDALSRSLVEKTNILAAHMSSPFITNEWMKMLDYPMDQKITPEQIISLIDDHLSDHQVEGIEKESLILLKEELQRPSLSPALIKGLIENIRKHPRLHWTSYLLKRYYDF
ncbi:TetR/AcrR family transcriptional regulator [Marinicrinis lubricantis]|uniref:TetR/AcrR family transcriptional regulator n=1 Tax=Marinicrinis lubricantis TaxID=2086470 RepID=A0ABW1IR00_9BACL